MFSHFQSSYARVEQSLQRLTDSIAAYNPSISAADELLVANGVVDKDLETLVTHQANHLRIQQLRQQSTSLDQKIKDTVKLIADLRRDIQAIPSDDSTTGTDGSRRDVSVDELLRYAKFISKTAPTVPRKTASGTKSSNAAQEASQAQITNGIATPPPGAQDSSDPASSRAEIVGLNAVPQHGQPYVAPPSEAGIMGIEPWPSHAQVQMSALADIQKMVEAGKDPGRVLHADDKEAAERERSAQEDRERAEQEERARRQNAYRNAAGRDQVESDTFDVDDL